MKTDETKGCIFTDAELIYAAHGRCPCGAGLAYIDEPRMTVRAAKLYGRTDHWDCSDILTGRAVMSGQPGAKTHTDRMPFVFWEIKSERQPSVHGATTRPKK